MLPEIYRVQAIGKGFIAVMAKPVGEWLEEEISGVARLGVNVVVSLLTDAESTELGLTEEEALCQQYNLEFRSFPIADRCVPGDMNALFELASYLHDAAVAGKGVVVHCRAGIGRSGLVAASVLVHHGFGPREALELISKVRRVSVPDTEEQAKWVEAYAAEHRGHNPAIKPTQKG